MVTDDSDPGGPSRRDFLKAGGVGALTMTVAGCEGLSEEATDGGSGNETEGGAGTGTPGRDGDGTQENPFVATPAGVGEAFPGEAADDLVRSTFRDERYTRIEGGIPGFEVPEEVTPVGHAATYGHGIRLPGGGEAESPPTLHTLSAGFLSLPNPDVEGAPTNPYAERSLSDLVSAGEGNLLLAAAGLGPTVEWLNDPVSVERTDADVEFVEGTMTVETFVGPVSAEPGRGMPDPAADGFFDDGATAPRPTMTTVHTARGFVGGNVVIVGMVNGWGRPPSAGPPPTEIGPEYADRLADIYEDVVMAELFRRALGEAGMILAQQKCDPDETGPPPEDAERTVEYSDYYGLTPDAQVELGYPSEQRLSTETYKTKLVGRTAPGPFFDCEEYDPEVHDPGEYVTLTFEQRVTAYTIGEEGSVRFGVVASPRAELEGQEQNRLVGGPLNPDLFAFDDLWNGVWSLVDELVPFDGVDWHYDAEPTVVDDFSDVDMLGQSADAKGFEGTISYAEPDGAGTVETNAYLYLARITTADEAILACAVSIDTGTDGFLDSQAGTRRLFENAVADVVADPGEPSDWVDGSVDDLNLVQVCRDTRLETGDGDALEQPNPQLVQGRNTAAPFDVSTFSGTSLSSRQLEYGVFSYDVANRPEGTFETILSRSNLDDFDTTDTDPDVLFDTYAGDGDDANDLPVFELQGSDSRVDLSFHAPSGYVHDVATVEEGPDYDITEFEVLRLGVTYVFDPDGGANYGDGTGYPAQYDETVDAVFEYLKRTYPTGLAVFQARAGIQGATKGLTNNAAKNETIDYRQTRVALERMADPDNGNWPYAGETLTHRISESEANTAIRNNGFDIWLLVVPEGYYPWHRDDSGPWGLGPSSDRLAVTTTDGGTGRFPDGPTTAAETAAQEVGHRIVSEPYHRPRTGNGEETPLAQRNSDGIDLEHARHLDSHLVDGTDAPGVVSRAYSLADGEFTVPTRQRWGGGGFILDGHRNAKAPFEAYGPDDTDQRVGRVESYMSYTIVDDDPDARSPWADSLITQDIINSDLNRAAGNLRTAKLGGITEIGTHGLEDDAEDDDGAPTVEAVEVFEDYVTGPDEERLAEAETTVDVSVVGPDGTVLREKTVPGALAVEHVDVDENRLDETPFDVELPPEAVDVELVGATSELRFNPITRPIRDAYERLPEGARGADFDREELETLLEGVDADVDEGNFATAREALATFAEQDLAGTIDPEFEPAANQYDEARMRALFDEMIGRLDGLAGGGGDGEIEVGEAGPWTDWVPAPSELPVFAESRGFYQYDVAATLNAGDITVKASLEDPMANPFVAGYFATIFWQQLGARGIGEAVVGPATVVTDADPSEVPAETGLLMGNVQVYLGSFDTDDLDAAVEEGEFSESDTPGVYTHDREAFAVAYGETYVVGAQTVDEVVTVLETGAGERDRWYEVNDEVAWLYDTGANGDFTLVNHLEDGTISEADSDLVDFRPFGEANGLAQSASLDGETFTDATTALVYPSEDAVELDLLRETLGVDAVDTEFAQEGRFVQVRATFAE